MFTVHQIHLSLLFFFVEDGCSWYSDNEAIECVAQTDNTKNRYKKFNLIILILTEMSMNT